MIDYSLRSCPDPDWSEVFFTSDHHFNHANIIKYCNRPFSSVGEMNEEMIRRWNSVVRPGDVVYHIGDFGFGSVQNLKHICQQLNGYKVLIRGNHDKGEEAMLAVGFNRVHDYTYMFGRFSKLLIHDVQSYTKNPDPLLGEYGDLSIVLYGHIHNTKVPEYDKMDTWINCCVENWDYTPVSDAIITKTLLKRIKNKARNEK